LFSSLVVVLASGCGQRFEFADKVEGTLTRNGQPLPDVHVEFVPDPAYGADAPHSSGVTDAKGFFRLTRNDKSQPGAVIGSHQVLLYPGRQGRGNDRGDADAGKQAPSAALVIPSRYKSAAQTPLKVEVKKEQTTYDLQVN
jgi:hypothetical protein